ncbi:MAG: DHHA1 domain-containing protein, partial [Pseudohongiellaceae bacterium]
KDKYHRPTIAFAGVDRDSNDGEIKGSARSIPGYHIRDALDTIASRNPSLLRKFGGHAMAAGLTIAARHLDQFAVLFADHANANINPDQLQARITTDGGLGPDELNLETAEAVLQAGPWGQGFPEPSFDGEFRVLEQRRVGGKHLKLQLAIAGTQSSLEAIAFNADAAVWPSPGDSVQLVYRLEINTYGGQRKLQLNVELLEIQ